MVLRALILIGGYGTRLRPLTFTKPKPLVEFANKPIVIHQIEALAAAGVKEIILAVSYRSKALQQELDYYGKQLGVKIIFSLETEPMGTAGPIALARKLLNEEDKDPFFMLNADVIAHYQFDKLLEFHLKHGREGTLYVTQVKDPSRYGVVVSKENGQITNFVEKPTAINNLFVVAYMCTFILFYFIFWYALYFFPMFVSFFLSAIPWRGCKYKELKYGNHINAGLYVFNKSMMKRIEQKPTSIEIDIFPVMAKDGELFRLELDSFWMDVGKPSDFIKGQLSC
ncbi:hypothetical protein RFI_32434 [Reticulomyxa filosa]|uniref:mannose-1-phosphate guanylyltransferase n=1 Tax=Reticulomyxa filosa TaxID=46433 RepID=X6LW75_RETFI|nr:hypothetical protein RFI_32434 [Reticulomyxa filosa]|eukprot:ETO04960.1 hypothetical protein RFI_32434 [Reticulomyxa filosa]